MSSKIHNNILLFFAFLLTTGCINRPHNASFEQDNLRIKTLYQDGRQYIKQNRNDSAMHCFIEAEKLINKTTNTIIQGKIYSNLGYLWGINKEYKLAIDYYEKSLHASQITNDQIGQAWSMLDLGDLYRWKNEQDTNALLWYTKASALTELNDTVKGALYQRIGLYHHHNAQYDSALVYLHKSVESAYFNAERSVRLLFLGKTYYHTKQLDSARHYLSHALIYPTSVRQKSGCYNTLYNVAVLEKDSAQMLYYADLINQSKDSIMRMEEQIRAQIRVYEKTQYHALNEKHDKQKQTLLIVLCGIAFIILGIGLWIWRSRKIQGKEIKQIHSKNVELKNKLQQSNRQKDKLLDMQKHIKEEIEKKEKFLLEKHRLDWTARLKEISTEAKKLPFMSNSYKEYITNAYREQLHTDDWERFSTLFNKDFNGFADKVHRFYKHQMPQTRQSVLFCCLLLLEVSKPEIEIIMNYTGLDSYKKRVSNLRRLFKVNTINELRLFLMTLMLKSKDEDE